MENLANHLKGRFVAGLFVLIPLGLTIFILKFLFGFADGILGPYLDSLYTAITRRTAHFPGLGMLTGAVVIYLTGLLATNVMGTRMLRWWDELLSRIPMVKYIYTSSNS